MHIALCCDKLWPIIAPFLPVNSTVYVFLLEEHEMAKQVWAGQGWDGDGYTSIHMHVYIALDGCVLIYRNLQCLASIVYTQEFILYCNFATKLQQCCHYCLGVVKKAMIEVAMCNYTYIVSCFFETIKIPFCNNSV